MSSTFSSRLKQLRIEKKLSQRALGALLGLSDKTISAYENNRNTPDFERLTKLSKIFGVSVDYLIGASENSESSETTLREYSLKTISVYNIDSLQTNKAVEYLKLPMWFGCDFGILVSDESCEPVLSKGDIALVRKGPALEGDLVLWREKEEKIVIRRIYFQGDSVILKPENSKYRPVIVKNLKISGSLLGVVVGRWQKIL